MPVLSTTTDTDRLTLTVVAEVAAPIERAWQLWTDARQLERWWGPPTWPATFLEHDVLGLGRSRYFMTGPEGEKAHGWWQVTAVDAPRSVAFDDGFSDDDGVPVSDGPVTRARVEFEETGPGTRMTITSTFDTVADLERLLAMGMAEGMTEAMGQMDAVLAA